jgi:hypothetical protein
MKLNYKGFKENPSLLTETKIYEHHNTRKIKKILRNVYLFRAHPFVLHPAGCIPQTPVKSGNFCHSPTTTLT